MVVQLGFQKTGKWVPFMNPPTSGKRLEKRAQTLVD